MTFTLERTLPECETDADWRQYASCQSCSPDLFFPAGSTGAAQHEIAAAKEVCAICPVQSQCLRFALRTGQAYGIWGGTTEEERVTIRRMTRERRAAALRA